MIQGLFYSCSTVYEDDNCSREYNQYNKIQGNVNSKFTKEGWNYANVNIQIYNSSQIRIMWCNLTNDTIIYVPSMWSPEIKISKRHSRCFYLNNDTLTIDYSKTFGIDYGLISAPEDSLVFGSKSKRLHKDSCILNIINTQELFPQGLQNVKYFHLKEYLGDIYKKNQ